MAKFFRIPFAQTGNRTVVPDPTQPNGSVSYSTGYGVDYERNPVTDPSAKMIERNEFNSVLFDVTEALRELQTLGFPAFITPAANGGTPFGYALNASVSFNGVNYISLRANNTDAPTVAASWRVFAPLHLPSVTASQAQVDAAAGDGFVTAATLRGGVLKTPQTGFVLTEGDIVAADTSPIAFGKTQRQLNLLDGSRLKGIGAGSSNVSIDNTDPFNPRISVTGSDASTAPTKATIVGGDGVVISDSQDNGALKRVAWSIIRSILNDAFLPSKTALGLSVKPSVVAADRFLIEDSADNSVPKVSTIQSLLNLIKTLTDGLYTPKDTAVLLAGGTMTGALTTPTVVLAEVSSAANHAIRRGEVTAGFLPKASAVTSGAFVVQSGALTIENGANAEQTEKIVFKRLSLPKTMGLYHEIDNSLSFSAFDPATGAWARTPLTIRHSGGVAVSGGLDVTGAISASTSVSAPFVTLAEEQATNPRNAATQKYVDDKFAAGGGIGTGQTWQSVSRGQNTLYQNTTGKPIFVAALKSVTGNNSVPYTVEVSNNGTNFYTVSRSFGAAAGVTIAIYAFFIVPVNGYYRFAAGDYTITELR